MVPSFEDGRHWSGGWDPILGPGDSNRSAWVNNSIDVLRKNCFSDYDTVACVRSFFLCFLSALTAVICLVRLVRLHTAAVSPCYHRLILFYCVFIHSLIGTVELGFGWTTQAALACAYLRSLELLIICHFYLTLTARVLHCSPEVSTRLSVFALSLLYVYFTAFVVIGLVSALTPWLDCFAPYWLWLSGGNVLTTQLMVCTSLILVRKINAVSAQDSLKRTQKRDLVWLIATFEVSVLADLAYHVAMFVLASDSIGCSGVFHHKQGVYSSVKVLGDVFTSLLPMWVILWVFRRPPGDAEQGSHQPSTVSSTVSMLDPSLMSGPLRQHRHLYRAPNERLVQSSLPYRRLRNRSGALRVRRRGGAVRRAFSAPSMIRSRRAPVATISATLDTIPEESIVSVESSECLDDSGSLVV